MHADLVYYRRRLAEEIAAAAAAPDPKISGIHLEFAKRYAERIGILEHARRDSSLHLVSAA